MIFITKELIQEIVNFSINELPDEACGYLGGKDFHITEIAQMTNVNHSPIEFSFDPSEQFSIAREFRKKNINILGVFHSHPNGSATLSQKDIEFAEKNTIQLIVVPHESTPQIRAYRVNRNVEEIPIQIQ